jgi:chromosome segregation ATPase
MNSLVLAASFLIVTLRGTFRGVEFLEPGTVLDVSRDLRNTMIANRAARDATAEEIAEYRNLHAAADLIGGDLQELARQKGDLEDAIYDLGQSKVGLAGEIEVLEQAKDVLAGEIEALGGERTELSAELEKLSAQHATLVTEVAALEAKAKPAKAVAK